MPFIGIGVGIGRQRFASGIFAAYAARVAADGGVTEAGACVDAVSALLQTASLLLVPSGYKSGVVYSEIPTNGNGDLTFTRASTANRTNSSGNIELMATGVPRLDYSQGSCPALLLEPQRTNTITFSENVTSCLPSQVGTTVTANATASPDGFQSADLVAFTTSSYRLRGQVVAAATTYTMSVFFKNNNFSGTESILFNMSDGVIGGLQATIQPANGTATYSGSAGAWTSVSGKVENYGNGWYRVSVTGTSVSGGSGWYELYSISSTKSAYFWGFSLEIGAYATSYIPTLGTSVTRVQENFSKTGLGLTNSTIFFEFTPTTTIAGLFDINKTVGGRAYYVALNSASFLTFNSVSGGTIGVIGSALTIGANYKIAMALNSATSQLSVFLNGAKLGTYTTDITTLGGFNGMSGFGYVPQYKIQSIAVFPTNLSDSEAIALTTL
jgi:hypothetical protein